MPKVSSRPYRSVDISDVLFKAFLLQSLRADRGLQENQIIEDIKMILSELPNAQDSFVTSQWGTL